MSTNRLVKRANIAKLELLEDTDSTKLLSQLTGQHFVNFKYYGRTYVGVVGPTPRSTIMFEYVSSLPNSSKTGLLAIQCNSQVTINVNVMLTKDVEAAAKQILADKNHYEHFIKQHKCASLVARIKSLSQKEALQRLGDFLAATNHNQPLKVLAATVVEVIDVSKKQVYVFPARHLASEMFTGFLLLHSLSVAPFTNKSANIENQYCVPHADLETFFTLLDHGQELKLRTTWQNYCENIIILDAYLQKAKAHVQGLYCNAQLMLPSCQLTEDILKVVTHQLKHDTSNQPFALIDLTSLALAPAASFKQAITTLEDTLNKYEEKYHFLHFLQVLKKHKVNIDASIAYTGQNQICVGFSRQRDVSLLRTLFKEIGANLASNDQQYVYVLKDVNRFSDVNLYNKYAPVVLLKNQITTRFETLCKTYPDFIYPLTEELFNADGSIDYFKVVDLTNNGLDILESALQRGMARMLEGEIAAKQRITAFKDAMKGLLVEGRDWDETEDELQAPVKRFMVNFINAHPLNGLSVTQEKTPRIVMSLDELICDVDDETFTLDMQTRSDCIKKFDLLDNMICVTRLKTDSNRFTDTGIVFKFKDDTCRNALIKCLEGLNLLSVNDGYYYITYDAIWNNACTLTEIINRKKQLESLLNAKQANTVQPVHEEVVVVAPAKSKQPVKDKNDKKDKKAKKGRQARNTQHQREIAAITTKQTSARKPAKSVRRGPVTAPQDPRRGQDPGKLKSAPFVPVAYIEEKPAQTDMHPLNEVVKPIAAQPLKEKAAILEPDNSHDGAMQHEANYLKELFDWLGQLDLLQQNEHRLIKIKEYSLWLSLVRLFNSMMLRFETNPDCVRLTRNEYEPGRMRYLRQFILHNLPAGEKLEELYKKMQAQKLDEIIDCALQGKPTFLTLDLAGIHSRFFQSQRKKKNIIELMHATLSDISMFIEHFDHHTKQDESVLQRLIRALGHGEKLNRAEEALKFEARAIAACVVRLGELVNDIPENHPFSAPIIEFMQSCRNPRNTTSHHDIYNPETGFDPTSLRDMLEMARKGCALFKSQDGFRLK